MRSADIEFDAEKNARSVQLRGVPFDKAPQFERNGAAAGCRSGIAWSALLGGKRPRTTKFD
jgi:hypothetical protein